MSFQRRLQYIRKCHKSCCYSLFVASIAKQRAIKISYCLSITVMDSVEVIIPQKYSEIF